MAAHFINVIKDMKEDQASGIQGLPQRLGTKRSVIVAITLIALGVLALYLTM
jgi:1,4-dihydroxy-2-naphthoate octaprenyltransferase